VKNLFFPNLKILEENVIAFNKAFSAPSVQSPLGTEEIGILPPEIDLCNLMIIIKIIFIYITS
jgi:hypothetical protein